MEGCASSNIHRGRPRKPLACINCRRKKLACDHKQPCTNCTHSRQGGSSCAYRPGSRIIPEPSEPSGPPESALQTSNVTAVVPRNHERGTWTYSILGNVLTDARVPSSDSTSQDDAHNVSWMSEITMAPIKGVMVKMRYVGTSHWLCTTLIVRNARLTTLSGIINMRYLFKAWLSEPTS